MKPTRPFFENAILFADRFLVAASLTRDEALLTAALTSQQEARAALERFDTYAEHIAGDSGEPGWADRALNETPPIWNGFDPDTGYAYPDTAI